MRVGEEERAVGLRVEEEGGAAWVGIVHLHWIWNWVGLDWVSLRSNTRRSSFGLVVRTPFLVGGDARMEGVVADHDISLMRSGFGLK